MTDDPTIGTAYVKVEIHPDSLPAFEAQVAEVVDARLRSLGGQLLEAHGKGAVFEDDALATLGGYLLGREDPVSRETP